MNDDFLDFIYDTRSEELAKLNEEDREFLNSPKADTNLAYQKFIDALENLSAENKKDILEEFNDFSDTSDFVHAYFYKKYYKLGFSECIKLILGCIST